MQDYVSKSNAEKRKIADLVFECSMCAATVGISARHVNFIGDTPSCCGRIMVLCSVNRPTDMQHS